MQYETILKDTAEAFEKKECYELLTGIKRYELKVSDMPIPIPTDWARVIPKGIHALFQQTKDPSVPEQFEQAVGRLLTEGNEKVWNAAYILFIQLGEEYESRASFLLNRNIFPLFHKAVRENRAFLESHETGWGGMTYFQDIQRMNRILWEDYGITFLPSKEQDHD